MVSRQAAVPDKEAAKGHLTTLWEAILNDETLVADDKFHELINSDVTAIRFCLPTQLLGKLTNNDLDALCLQKGNGENGRWDPRGFASKVIVPWNQANQSVLGPGADPYVNNPLRRPRVDMGLSQMADRSQWETLCHVLQEAQEAGSKEHTETLLSQTLIAIRDRLKEHTFLYIVPERVSLKQAESLVDQFLTVKSGGDRGLAVAAALFETVGERLGIYEKIRRGRINAADAVTGSAGDLECLGPDGKIVLAVEVKEQKIGIGAVNVSIAKAREFAVKELIFCCEGITQTDKEAVEKTFSAAWASGTNLYQVTIKDIMRGMLPLLGEGGVKMFVAQVGEQLDKFSTQPKHRKAWKALLDSL